LRLTAETAAARQFCAGHFGETPTPGSIRPLLPDMLRPAVPFSAQGHGLPSQRDFIISGEAFVTDTPITLLGFVNRHTGVIEEPGHPAHGQSMAGKIAIFPKGTGSTVAPYVLLELFYRGRAPLGHCQHRHRPAKCPRLLAGEHPLCLWL
jgi:hypothetical protein